MENTHLFNLPANGSTTFQNRVHPGTVGLLESTILPSFGIQSGLSLIAYGIGRYTDRVDAKDWLWPSGQVLNVWWSAIGRRIYYEGISLPKAMSTLSWSEKLLVGGFTLWGGRLLYRIASRSVRRGEDDPRYEELKEEEGFWNKSFFTVFLPEAAVQALITLPFTIPFLALPSETWHCPSEYYNLVHGLAVGLFSAGFSLEVLADAQLETHLAKSSGLHRDGVWSIVRHPNYLGDALVHASFPILLYGSGLLHPLSLLGPLSNYVFLRHIGGTKEKEKHQTRRYSTSDPEKMAQLEQWRKENNSFWPAAKEAQNPWLWTVIGCGVAGMGLEWAMREYL